MPWNLTSVHRNSALLLFEIPLPRSVPARTDFKLRALNLSLNLGGCAKFIKNSPYVRTSKL